VTVNARVRCFDFEGRADAYSVRRILCQVAPRTLILIGGGAEETASLAAHCARELAPLRTRVLAPRCGEGVDAPLPPSYRVALTDAVFNSLRFQTIKTQARSAAPRCLFPHAATPLLPPAFPALLASLETHI